MLFHAWVHSNVSGRFFSRLCNASVLRMDDPQGYPLDSDNILENADLAFGILGVGLLSGLGLLLFKCP